MDREQDMQADGGTRRVHDIWRGYTRRHLPGVLGRIREIDGRAGGAATTAYRDALRRDPCAYCGDRSAHLDHVVPRAKGGTNDWTNLAPACASCNQLKGSASLLAFLSFAAIAAAWRVVGA